MSKLIKPGDLVKIIDDSDLSHLMYRDIIKENLVGLIIGYHYDRESFDGRILCDYKVLFNKEIFVFTKKMIEKYEI